MIEKVYTCLFENVYKKRDTSDTDTLRDNERQQVATTGTTSDNEWQRVTTNDKEWYNEWYKEWQGVTSSAYFC